MPPDVAKELGIDIDIFLDSLIEKGYYHCPKCGKIVNIEEVGDELETPCNKCRENNIETVIKLNIYGIVVALTDLELHAIKPNRYGGGSITSDLKESCPICEGRNCYRDCPTEFAKDKIEDEDDMESRLDFNKRMDALESIILGHACAGIDIESPAYIEGIETAVEGCANS